MVKASYKRKDNISNEVFGKPYSWLDAHEAKEVDDYIKRNKK